MLNLVIMLILAAMAIALFNWRWGILAAIGVGLLQDPLRKMIPGTPGLLAMASLPVWLTVLGAAIYSGRARVGPFLDAYPRFGRAAYIFGGYLVIPAFISATYGHNTWQITLLGLLIYTTAFLALVVGWSYAVHERARLHLLGFYTVFAAAMLMGGPLEWIGMSAAYDAIGTEALGNVWVTHRTGETVRMMAGFFRGPDVMGWHAALVFMLATIMALRTRGPARIAWIVIAVWGAVNIWLCGRRKMLSMIPVFLGCYIYLIFHFKNARRYLPAFGVLIMTIGLGWFFISTYVRSNEVQVYYLSTIYELDEQVIRHGYDSVLTTLQQAGFFGYGLGMGQQGTHHIHAEKPRLWQESGPSKLFAELGVPGAFLFLWAVGLLLLTSFHVVKGTAEDDTFYVSAGILSAMVANLASAVVSAQIYGDPLVAVLLAIMVGMLLAGSRIAHVRRRSG